MERCTRNDDERRTSGQVTMTCSCHARWGGEGVLDYKCWHLDCLVGNEKVIGKLRNFLESGLDVQNRTYFGDIMNVTE